MLTVGPPRCLHEEDKRGAVNGPLSPPIRGVRGFAGVGVGVGETPVCWEVEPLWASLVCARRTRTSDVPEPPAFPRDARAGYEVAVRRKKEEAGRGAVTSFQDGGESVKKLCPFGWL